MSANKDNPLKALLHSVKESLSNWIFDFTKDKEARWALVFALTMTLTIMFLPGILSKGLSFLDTKGGEVVLSFKSSKSALILSLWISAITFLITWLLLRIPNQMRKIREEQADIIGQVFTAGIHSLFDQVNDSATQAIVKLNEQFKLEPKRYRLNSTLRDLLLSSLASVRSNGYSYVDATASDYVRYISLFSLPAEEVVMTCVPRPFWFLADEIGTISLPPSKKAQSEYGKGEHLQAIRAAGCTHQRWLIVDEEMIGELLATAYIAQALNSDETPPRQEEVPFDADDLPEIAWMQNEVTSGPLGSTLFTLVRKHLRQEFSEFSDSICFYYKNDAVMSLSFQFLGAETGLMRINASRRLRKIPCETFEDGRSFVEASPIAGGRKHKFYKSFRQLLKDDLIEAVRSHVNNLHAIWIAYSSTASTANRPSYDKLLAMISDPSLRIEMSDNKELISQAVRSGLEKLSEDLLGSRPLLEIYNQGVRHFKKKGVPRRFYILDAQSSHPLRPVTWRLNWDGDGDKTRGIINTFGHI